MPDHDEVKASIGNSLWLVSDAFVWLVIVDVILVTEYYLWILDTTIALSNLYICPFPVTMLSLEKY